MNNTDHNMLYFNQAYLEFFACLKRNNNKQWFHQHKEIYALTVDRPFRRFITDLVEKACLKNSSVSLTAGQAIFRQNRDMRFARRLPPYKEFKSALISESNLRSKEVPGFYIEIGHDHVLLGGGIYKLNAGSRMKIAGWDPTGISQQFRLKYGTVTVDHNRKAFTYESRLESSVILQEDFMSLIMDYWRSGQEVNRWLAG